MGNKQVMTVDGLVDADKLGITYAHEHLIVQPQISEEIYIPYTLKNQKASTEEAKLFSKAGGKTIVEMTPIYYGRDVQAYREIAYEAGIHVVCCTGFHKELFMPPWFKSKTLQELYGFVLNEIENGIDGTSIRPGVIKIGTSFHTITKQEARAIEIAARLHKDTGIPISTHCEKGTAGMKQLDLFEQLGVSPEEVLLCHIDSKHDIHYAKALCARGATICIDHVGRNLDDKDEFCVRMITELVEAGFANRVVLAGDMGKIDYLPSYGGKPGLTYILTELKDTLMKYISEQDFWQMLIENPQRFLSGDDEGKKGS